MVLDHQFGYGSGSKLNCIQIDSPGCQHTGTVNSEAFQWNSAKPTELGWLSVGHPAGQFVDSYNALRFAV